MSDDPEAILRAWYEQVWNQKNIEAIDRLLAEDALAHGLVDASGNTARGPEAFKHVFHQFHTAFPDLHIELAEVVSQRDICAVRCIVRGTHLGESLGIAATGRKVEFTGMNFARIEGGQIVEGWNNFDFATMQAQLTAPSL